MTDARLLLGSCGLYCGACFHYRASLPEGQHLLDAAREQGRDMQGFTCSGCRSNVHYMSPICAQCKIRACADARGLLHCGLCPELPCEMLTAFQFDGRLHHLDILEQFEALLDIGPDPWLVEQEARWKCACGASYSWYEATCNKCGAPLNFFK
jgi:hypothetical protein